MGGRLRRLPPRRKHKIAKGSRAAVKFSVRSSRTHLEEARKPADKPHPLSRAAETKSMGDYKENGAGSRDRTGILSLEGCCTTIVLYPRRQKASGWWRRLDSNQRRHSQRVYSPSPLATRALLRNRNCLIDICFDEPSVEQRSLWPWAFGLSTGIQPKFAACRLRINAYRIKTGSAPYCAVLPV